MGCFNEICSISHIPIAEGDKTVKLYVGSKTNIEYYGHGKYLPISLPLFGTYDDYGDIQDVDNTSTEWKMLHRIINDEFNKVIRPTERIHSDSLYDIFKDNVGGNSNQMLPDLWAYDISALEKIEDDSPYRKHDAYKIVKNNNSVVRKMFIHEAVFNYFVEYFMERRYYGFNQPEYTGRELFNQIPLFVDNIIEKALIINIVKELSDIKEIDVLLQQHNILSLHSLYSNTNMTLGTVFDDHHYLNKIFNIHNDEDSSLLSGAAIYIKNIIMDIAKNVNITENADSRQEMIDIISNVFILNAFGIGLRCHGHDFTPFIGHAPGQYQDKDEAKDMLNMFNVFQRIQLSKLDEIIMLYNE